MSSASFDADVTIVGGGLAGTVAAARLKAAGASVLLLEARDRLGGRTCTRPFCGAPFDFGAQFIGPGQPGMYRLVKELGLATSPTPVRGRKSLELGGRIKTYSGTIPLLNPMQLLRLHLSLARINRLSRRVQPSAPWDMENAAALDALTLADWYRRQSSSEGDVENMAAAVLRTVFGAEADEMSLLYVLWYVASSGGLMPLVETRGGFQQDRIVGGTQQIAERLGAALGPGAIRLDEVVREIRQDAAGVSVHATSGSWRAKRTIVSAPLSLAGHIAFDPQLPKARERLHRGVHMGSTVKVLAAYGRPFWRERGLSGQAVGTQGLQSVIFDNTAPGDAVPCLLGFVVGRAVSEFREMAPAERRARILDELARFFGEEARHPVDYAEMDWGQEPFSGGCPTGFFGPGTISSCGDALTLPAGRVHWAGTETARRCIGYMEGAVESGDRVAAEVLSAL